MTEALAQSRGAPHVVHVVASLKTGGAERQLVNYLQAANHDDFRHTVLCLEARGEFAEIVEKCGIPVVVKPVRMRRFWWDLTGLGAWLREQDVRVIHTHMHAAAFWGRLAALKAGVPVLVTTEHGKELWKSWWQVAADRWLSGRTYRHFAVSRDVMAIRKQRERVADDRIRLLPNGVPTAAVVDTAAAREAIRAEFGLAAAQPVIGSVGRVVDAKDYPGLLAGFALARRDRPDLHWLQIGSGPDLEYLKAAVSAADLNDAVTFAGRRSDIQDLLAAMDIWVMSSIREGLPVALLEAMAAAKPIVATRVGGIPDAVADEISALLVAPGDPAAMSAAILRLVENPSLASGLGQGARAVVQERYGIETIARITEETYRSGLADLTSAGS